MLSVSKLYAVPLVLMGIWFRVYSKMCDVRASAQRVMERRGESLKCQNWYNTHFLSYAATTHAWWPQQLSTTTYITQQIATQLFMNGRCYFLLGRWRMQWSLRAPELRLQQHVKSCIFNELGHWQQHYRYYSIRNRCYGRTISSCSLACLFAYMKRILLQIAF